MGDLSQKITVTVQGSVMIQLKEVINTMVDRLAQFAAEVTRVSQEVGTEGKLGGQAYVADVEGTWLKLTAVVNKLAANLSSQVRSIAEVTKAVARGDLSKQIEVDASGEILDLKNTVNSMVIRLRSLAAEVTRVSLEVGTEGKLGGQAVVADVEGVWQELTTNVNKMCSNLTNQVRSIAVVTTAVAKGDLSQMIEIEVEGEMATLKDTVNSMVAQLNTFASEVTRVALEVGTMGVLGGQATVEGVQGTWAELTDNVNVSHTQIFFKEPLLIHESRKWPTTSPTKCDPSLKSPRLLQVVILVNSLRSMSRVKCLILRKLSTPWWLSFSLLRMRCRVCLSKSVLKDSLVVKLSWLELRACGRFLQTT